MAVFLLLGQLGVLLDLPQVVLDLSPFTHVPAAPVAEVTAAPMTWLVVVAAIHATAGGWAFRRRDIPA